MAGARSHCSHCGRSPLPGELVLIWADDECLCSLCSAAGHERDDAPLRTERVRTNNALVRRRTAFSSD